MVYYLNFDPYPKQRLFLSCPADELLFGGAVGGSKSASSIVKALQIGCYYPGAHIGLFRSSLIDLRATLLKETRKWFPPEIYKYSAMDRMLYMTNGSQISFNYISCPADRENYSSWQFDATIIDEATLIDEGSIVFLKTRVRSALGIPTRKYYLTNPIGISRTYFKRRFVDGKKPFMLYKLPESVDIPDGGMTLMGVFTKPTYGLYLPSYLTDNPSILVNDPAYMRSLTELPEDEFNALLFGSWDIRSGLFFQAWDQKDHVVDEYIHNEKDTFFMSVDWGYTRPSSVGVYAIRQDRSICRFDEIYTMKENMPDNGTQIAPSELGAMINEKIWELKKMYNNSPNIIIVDSQCWVNDPETHECIIDHFMAQTNQHKVSFIKSTKERINGWQSINRYLKFKMFTVAKKCENFIRTFPEMLHDKNIDGDIDCFVAGTKVSTLHGYKNIEDITINDYMETPIGYRKVIKDGISGIGKTILVKFSNGKKLRGTLNHKIFIKGKGLVELCNVSVDDIVNTRTEDHLCITIKKFYTMVLGMLDTKIEDIIQLLQRMGMNCIVKYTLMPMVLFLKVIMFIIKMLILITMNFQTLNLYLLKSMQKFIIKNEKMILLLLANNGALLIKAKNSLNKMLLRCEKKLSLKDCRASIVENILLKEQLQVSTVQKNAKKNLINRLLRPVKFAVKFLIQNIIQIKKQKPVRIVAVGNIEERTVYNLTVNEARLYYAEDILVTNTRAEDHIADEFRYLCAFVPQPKFYEEKIHVPQGSMAWHDQQIKNRHSGRLFGR